MPASSKKKTVSKKKTAAKKKSISKKKKSAKQAEEFLPKEYYNLINNAHLKLDSPKRKEKLKGIELYTKAIKMAPEENHGYFNRGQGFEKLEKYEEALSDFNKCISLDPDCLSFYESSAVVLGKMGLYDEAADCMQKSRKLTKYPYQTEYIRSFKNQMKRLEEACSEVNAKIQKNPDNAIFYHEKGQILNELGEYYPAIRQFQKALELNPEFTEAETDLGICLFMVKLFERSEEHLSRVLENEPENLIAVMMRGFAQKELDKYEGALKDLRKALSLDSGNELVKNDIAELEKKLGNSGKKRR